MTSFYNNNHNPSFFFLFTVCNSSEVKIDNIRNLQEKLKHSGRCRKDAIVNMANFNILNGFGFKR